MIPRPPRSTRTDPLFPYTTLFRSPDVGLVERAVVAAPAIALVDGAVPVELVIPCRCPGRRLHREFGAGMELVAARARHGVDRSEEHTSELQSLMRISYAVFCLKKKKITYIDIEMTTY